uniref:Chaperone protein DnaK n=1 Tax=Rhabditophanes sp. KR3021 TaxID=114890 RepID=A0AC35TQR6_9BILA
MLRLNSTRIDVKASDFDTFKKEMDEQLETMKKEQEADRADKEGASSRSMAFLDQLLQRPTTKKPDVDMDTPMDLSASGSSK